MNDGRQIVDLEERVATLEEATPDGGSQPGVGIWTRYQFAFDDAGLSDGIDFYTPTIGDLLIDAIVTIDEAFDGTTPFVDISDFDVDAAGVGWFGWWKGPLDASIADAGSAGFSGDELITQAAQGPISDLVWQSNYSTTPQLHIRALPAAFGAVSPIKAVCSQDGKAGSDPPGATAGAFSVYLCVASF